MNINLPTSLKKGFQPILSRLSRPCRLGARGIQKIECPLPRLLSNFYVYLPHGKYPIMHADPTKILKPRLAKNIIVKQIQSQKERSLWAELDKKIWVNGGSDPAPHLAQRYLAYLDGEAAGIAELDLMNPQYGSKIGHLCSLGVLPEARNKGVATALTDKRIQRAAEEGCFRVFTIREAEPKENHPTEKLGNKFGFTNCCKLKSTILGYVTTE